MKKQQQPKLKMKNDPLAQAMAGISIADLSAGGYSTQPKSQPTPAARINPYIEGYKAPPMQLTRWQRLKQTARRYWLRLKQAFSKKN